MSETQPKGFHTWNSRQELKRAYPSVERMQQRVSGPVCHAAAAMSLASLSILQALTSKGSLVDPPVFGAAERHAKVLQLKQKEQHELLI